MPHAVKRPLRLIMVAAVSAILPLTAPSAQAQTVVAKPDSDASMQAVRCELRLTRSPDAIQVFYYYLSDARRGVFETDGNALGNVVQFGKQRIVITKNNVEGATRTYTFDRMIGALTITSSGQVGQPAGMSSGTSAREPWTMSGECQKIDASKQKF